MAVLRRCTTSCGALPGRKKPNHSVNARSLKPCSTSVGVLGVNLPRFGPLVDSRRHLPLATCWVNSPVGPDTAAICPLIMSSTAGCVPR